MIPRVIHYCWFGGGKIPGDLKKYIESWERYCPEYEIKCWNEDNFDVNTHPFTKSAYEAKAWAFVSDYARLKIIYNNGGIYLDTDVEILKSLDLLLENKCYIGVQQHGDLCNTGLGFGAEKYNFVVGKMLEKYNGLVYSEEYKSRIACPWLNDSVIRSLGYKNSMKITYMEDVTVYPSKYFDPLSTGNTSNLLCDDTVSIHHYAASWTSEKNRMKRRLIRTLGEDKYHKLKKIFRRAQ